MEIHKKFSIPVACFVFAVLGLALGASNRKDGKLASFVLGIGVIFVYYVIMFTAEALTKGILDAGVAGDVAAEHRPRRRRRRSLLIIARALGRSADPHLAAALAHAVARNGDAAAPPSAGECEVRRAQPRGRSSSFRVPQFELPRPTLLDIYIAQAVPPHPRP